MRNNVCGVGGLRSGMQPEFCSMGDTIAELHSELL